MDRGNGYFRDVGLGVEVYSVVYGEGKVTRVINKSDKLEGFYTFGVTFTTGQKVHYTDEGIPNWCHSVEGCQTLWYRKDIDLLDEDIVPTGRVLTRKKIVKLRSKNKLEMKCPTGIWRDISGCPEQVVAQAVSNESWHLFREKDITDG